MTLLNFTNDEDIIDSSQECGVILKYELKVDITTDADLDYTSDDELFEENDTVNVDHFVEEFITPPPAKPGSTTNTHGLLCSTLTSRPPHVTKLIL